MGDSRIEVPKQVPISMEIFFHLNIWKLYHTVEWTSGNQAYVLGTLKYLIIKRFNSQIFTFVDFFACLFVNSVTDKLNSEIISKPSIEVLNTGWYMEKGVHMTKYSNHFIEGYDKSCN